MNWGPWLFVFFLVVFFTKSISAGFIGYWCWSNRRLNGSSAILARLGILFSCVAYNNLSQLIANAFGFTVRPVYTHGYAVAYWQGEVVSMAGMIMVALFLLRGGKTR